MTSPFESMDKVLEYIFDHESEDFYENPSDNHVYYHAVIARLGEKAAIKELSLALDNKHQNERKHAPLSDYDRLDL